MDAVVEAERKRKFRNRFIIFTLVLALVVALCVFAYLRYSAPIDLAKATPDRAASWLVFRDLSEETPETQAQLFDLYFDKISVADPSGESEKSGGYALPSAIQRFSGVFLSGRDEAVQAWRLSNERLPILRVDYAIVPSKSSKSVYVTSCDVKPGPSLSKRWNARREGSKDVALYAGEKKTTIEKNVQLLIFHWFVSRCKQYDAASDDAKKQTLDAIVADLNNFQAFYNDLRKSAGMSSLTRVGMLREFDMTIDGWLDFASVEDLARVLWFKDLLVAIVVSQTSNPLADADNANADDQDAEGTASAAKKSLVDFEYPPRKPTEASNKDSDAPIAPACAKTLDALKGYLFKR